CEKVFSLGAQQLEREISLSFIPVGRDRGGGVDRVRTAVHDLRSAGIHSVCGIIDWDGNHVTSEPVFVVGENARYGIENYVYDPVLLAGFLLRERLVEKDALGLQAWETYVDLRDFGNERLQQTADAALLSSGFPIDGKRAACRYVCGRQIDAPISFL